MTEPTLDAALNAERSLVERYNVLVEQLRTRATTAERERDEAVADNAALRQRGRAIYDWLQFSRGTAPGEEWDLRHRFADGSSVASFIDSFAEPTDHPGAALLREHERLQRIETQARIEHSGIEHELWVADTPDRAPCPMCAVLDARDEANP